MLIFWENNFLVSLIGSHPISFINYIGNEEEYACIPLGHKFHVTKIVPLGHYCGMVVMYYGMAQYGLFHQGMQQQKQARLG
jgi:hypothetical protein